MKNIQFIAPLLATALVTLGISAAYAGSGEPQDDANGSGADATATDQSFFEVEDVAQHLELEVFQLAGDDQVTFRLAPWVPQDDAGPSNPFVVASAQVVIEEMGATTSFPFMATATGFEAAIGADLIFAPGRRTVVVDAAGADASGGESWTAGLTVEF